MPENVEKELEKLAIGKKIRELRHQKNISIHELSEKIGLSGTLISQIENELISPPISTLMKIANALDVEIAHFFQEKDTSQKITIVRKNERILSERREIKGKANIGYTYELLAHKKTNKHMEPFIVTFEPRERKDVITFKHSGEEFHFVLKGRVEMVTENQEPIILEEGDALYFESDIAHGFRALDGKPAKTLAVVIQKTNNFRE